MKNLFKIILLAAICGRLLAANIQIENLSTQGYLPSTDDFTIWSGATNSTRKFAVTGMTFLTATRTSLAAFSITGVADGTGILVLGATSAGDGGGASYFWSASSTATPNGNTVIQPASLPGTGRWLKATGNTGVPGPSTLGGVFSNAGGAHLWVSSINTDGTVTLTQPGIADVSGLGSMAGQNSSAISVSGGLITGTTFSGGTISGAPTINVTTSATIGQVLSLNTTGAVDPFVSFNNSGGGFGGFTWNIRPSAANGNMQFNGGGTWLTLGYSTGLLTFSTMTSDTNAHLRTTKGNLNIVINVRDYGATGNGSTDDTTAINSAIAALVSHATLLFPAGKYRITAGLTALDTLQFVTVRGDGAEIYNDSGASGANTLVVNTTCTYIEICNLRFTGTASVRGSGIHIRLGSSYSSIHDCFFQGCSDFGVLVSYGSGGYVFGDSVTNCIALNTLGDGFHFGSAEDCIIADCQAISTGDDALGIVADYLGTPPNRIVVSNFKSYQAGNHAGGGTHGCGIRVVDGANDIDIIGGQDYQPCEAGVYVGRAASTTAYNAHIKITGRQISYPMQNAGMLGGITIQFSNQMVVDSCTILSPQSANCISALDSNDLVINGNSLLYPALRGFGSDDGTTTNVASSCLSWTISNNTMSGTPTNESFYVVAPTGKVINNVIIDGNKELGPAAGTGYIFTNRLATAAKVVNNTSLGGRSISNGGSGVAPTTANNN